MSSDNFKKYVLVSEQEYKDLIKKKFMTDRPSGITDTKSDSQLPLALENSKKLVSDIEHQIQQDNLKERDERERFEAEEEEEKEEREKRKEKKEEKKKQENPEEKKEETLAVEDRVKESRGRPVKRKPTKNRPSPSSQSVDTGFNALIDTSKTHFEKKYHARVISLLKRLSATGYLKVRATRAGLVRNVLLDKHQFSVTDFIDLISISQTLKKKPEVTKNLEIFGKFLTTHNIPKTLIFNPYLKKTVFPSKLSPSPSRPPSSKKKSSAPSKKRHGVKWFTSELNVSDSD